MLEKLALSDDDYEYLTKGIAAGVGIGILVGAFIGNIILTFAAGGLLGVFVGSLYSFYKKVKAKKAY